MFNILKNLKNQTSFKSDYVSVNNSQSLQQTGTPLPNGYPCTYDSDCASPSVCQYNVCTSNYTVNEGPSVYDICKGLTPVDCAKQMQKQRENEEMRANFFNRFVHQTIMMMTLNDSGIDVGLLDCRAGTGPDSSLLAHP